MVYRSTFRTASLESKVYKLVKLLNMGVMLQSQQTALLGSFGHMILALRIEEMIMEFAMRKSICQGCP